VTTALLQRRQTKFTASPFVLTLWEVAWLIDSTSVLYRLQS
jgi:hypothetical protein